MKFTVIWSHAALDELAHIWLDSLHRNDITDAAARIDRQLESDPLEAGESRENARRILIEPPLAVIFKASSVGQTALVLHVRRSRPEASSRG